MLKYLNKLLENFLELLAHLAPNNIVWVREKYWLVKGEYCLEFHTTICFILRGNSIENERGNIYSNELYSNELPSFK